MARRPDSLSGPLSRRAALGLAVAAAGLPLMPAHAAGPDAFAQVERGFAVRLRGPKAVARAFAMGELRPGPATNLYYRQLLAASKPGSPFTDLEMRLSRSHPAGLVVLTARAGLPITPVEVRRRYGAANWTDIRPELPTWYLHYPRSGGALSFGFSRGGEGSLTSAVLVWGEWA